jgi:hypothetical protein
MEELTGDARNRELSAATQQRENHVRLCICHIASSVAVLSSLRRPKAQAPQSQDVYDIYWLLALPALQVDG